MSGRAGKVSFEGAIQVTIMLAIGAAAGAASFTHVHDVAEAHGQGGWLAWADAVVLELMSVASGLEIRRRKKLGARLSFPLAVLCVSVFLSLSAQVVEAEPSPIGWIAAAIPALGFLVMVKIALAQFRGAGSVDMDEPPAVSEEGACRPDPVVELLTPAARSAAQRLQAQGRRVTRAGLAESLRADGYGVSNGRASALLRKLRSDPDMHLPPAGFSAITPSVDMSRPKRVPPTSRSAAVPEAVREQSEQA